VVLATKIAMPEPGTLSGTDHDPQG
jgi:hypothetical protein